VRDPDVLFDANFVVIRQPWQIVWVWRRSLYRADCKLRAKGRSPQLIVRLFTSGIPYPALAEEHDVPLRHNPDRARLALAFRNLYRRAMRPFISWMIWSTIRPYRGLKPPSRPDPLISKLDFVIAMVRRGLAASDNQGNLSRNTTAYPDRRIVGDHRNHGLDSSEGAGLRRPAGPRFLRPAKFPAGTPAAASTSISAAMVHGAALPM